MSKRIFFNNLDNVIVMHCGYLILEIISKENLHCKAVEVEKTPLLPEGTAWETEEELSPPGSQNTEH